jgi:trehalose 2-sulfotransferase
VKVEREDKIWTRQFAADLDFPEHTPRVRFVICGSPRCGSHLLGHSLHDTGLFGYPLEYMNPTNLPRWAGRAAAEGGAPDRVLPFLERRRTSPNGVFGIKLFVDHLANFRAHGGDLRDYRAILLLRRDVVAQAVSFDWAVQSGSWISQMPERAQPRYNPASIARRLEEIVEADGRWRKILGALGVPTLHMLYEDVAADPGAATARIAAHCDVAFTEARQGARFIPERQESPAKREWTTRFRAEVLSDDGDAEAACMRIAELARRPRRRSSPRRAVARLIRLLRP